MKNQEEFQAALDSDQEAKAFFENLPLSNQDVYRIFVEEALDAEERQRHAAKAVGLLRQLFNGSGRKNGKIYR